MTFQEEFIARLIKKRLHYDLAWFAKKNQHFGNRR